MVVVDVALALATKDMLIKQWIIPADIMTLIYRRNNVFGHDAFWRRLGQRIGFLGKQLLILVAAS